MKRVVAGAAAALFVASSVSATAEPKGDALLKCLDKCDPKDVVCRARCVGSAAPSEQDANDTWSCIHHNCGRITNNPTKAADCNTHCIDKFFLHRTATETKDYSADYDYTPPADYDDIKYDDAYNGHVSDSYKSAGASTITKCLKHCDAGDVVCRADCVGSAAPSAQDTINTFNCIRDNCGRIGGNPTKASECNTQCIDKFFLKKGGSVSDYSKYWTVEVKKETYYVDYEYAYEHAKAESTTSMKTTTTTSSKGNSVSATTTTTTKHSGATLAPAPPAKNDYETPKYAQEITNGAEQLVASASAFLAGLLSFAVFLL